MKTLFTFIILTLLGCNYKPYSKAREFSKYLPDTSKTWAGKQTLETFYQTRKFEKLLSLESLENGQLSPEFRIWDLSSSVDPQSLFILKSTTKENWELRHLTFNHNDPKKILQDSAKSFKLSQLDSSNIEKWWKLYSQSDLNDGDTFGCTDGNILFIELSDWAHYTFKWFNCPFINQEKNPVFLEAYKLSNDVSKMFNSK